jgi:hypothetical protein
LAPLATEPDKACYGCNHDDDSEATYSARHRRSAIE